MVYLISSIALIPEKTQEFSDMFEKEFLPIAERYGMKLVGCWRTMIGNIDEVTFMWGLESLDQYEKIGQARMQDPEYLKVRRKIRSLMTLEITKIASPLPPSPLK